MFHRLQAKSVASLVAVCAACADTGTQPGADGKWIEILPASFTATGLDVPVRFTPVVMDATGAHTPVARLVWRSSKPHVVAVTSPGGSGMVLAYGAATVTAESNGRIGAALVLSNRRPATDATEIEIVSRSAAISAAVLGQGDLAAQGRYFGCSYTGLWTSFPRGTSIPVRVSTTVPAGARDAIQIALEQVAEVTHGSLTATFQLTGEADPVPTTHEVTVVAHPTPTVWGCLRDVGCTLHTFSRPGVIRSSRVVLPPFQTANAFVHDVVGHAILGMCHLSAMRIGRPQNSLMSNGPGMTSSQIPLALSPLDVELVQAVWASPLDPGADAEDFRRAGMIHP